MSFIRSAAFRFGACACLLLGFQPSTDLPACGSLAFGYGPYDYRTDRDKLAIVEQYHFTPLVESMVKPMFTTIASDLSYTLKAFPNHHRALVTLVRNSERLKSLQPPGAEYSVDCYFERAMRFRRDDLIVRMIYADFLGRQGRSSEAKAQLDFAVSEAGDNVLTHLNAGLIYVSIKEFEKAAAQVETVERLGGDPKLLRDKLREAGSSIEIPATPKPTANEPPAATR
jgi:hypothetical protein